MKPNPRRVSPMDERIGLSIKARRLELNLSQTDLGKRCGITFQQVQKYEQGINRVSASRLQTIAKVLDVDITYFYDTEGVVGNGTLKHHPSALQTMATPEGLELVTAFAGIKNKDLRRSIADMVKKVARENA